MKPRLRRTGLRAACLGLALLLASALRGADSTTNVVVHNAAEFRAAVAAAGPGTRIALAPGAYGAGFNFSQLQGAPGRPIVIAAADPAARPVFGPGRTALHLSSAAHVELEDLEFAGLTDNGLNIDDGGRREGPGSHHVVLRRLHLRDVGPKGNCDGIKLSGVSDFLVSDCHLERWGDGGSGVDLVGCHRGVIEGNTFRHTDPPNANAVQCKGGTSGIAIRRNRFEHPGGRGVNLGGSTGLEFFRPPLAPDGELAEARDLRVEGNWFVGGACAVAFVGVDGAVVRFNTIDQPGRWALRILQENRAPRFVPSRRGEFSDNLIRFASDHWSEGGVNLGPLTAPDTFVFARNTWICTDRPERSRPRLPTAEIDGRYGPDAMAGRATAGAEAWPGP